MWRAVSSTSSIAFLSRLHVSMLKVTRMKTLQWTLFRGRLKWSVTLLPVQPTASTTGPTRPRLSLSSLRPKPLSPSVASPSLAISHERLRQPASSPALASHAMSTDGWNDWIFHSTDWASQAKALNTLKCTQELFVTKWAQHLLPPRRHMKPMGQAESDLCPSCLATSIETAPHVFACPK
jgi:hypothetical protein